ARRCPTTSKARCAVFNDGRRPVQAASPPSLTGWPPADAAAGGRGGGGSVRRRERPVGEATHLHPVKRTARPKLAPYTGPARKFERPSTGNRVRGPARQPGRVPRRPAGAQLKGNTHGPSRDQ